MAIVARREEVLNEACDEISGATSATVKGYACDVSDKGALEKMHADVTGDLGPIDILVNNAGASARGTFWEITDEEWAFDFELKVYAAIRLIRLSIPSMIERNWGRVINILNSRAKAPNPAAHRRLSPGRPASP